MRCCTFSLLIAVAVSAGTAPLGTDFTYQGVLSDSGSPANGAFDFRFILYNADSGGAQVGSTVHVDDATVTGGRVTLQIDFGSVFDGTALWLEVGVRDGASTGSYTVLSPRQELTAGPYALHAMDAQTAGYAADADLLDGQTGSFYLSWYNLTNIPPGLNDGDDDSLGVLSCSPNEIASWTGTAWICSPDAGVTYARTYVVSPVGTITDNGTALRDAIMAIPPPSSEDEAVLIKIEPGTYDVGSTFLPLWSWMAVEGAGEAHTKITADVCSAGINWGTIRADSDYIELRHLTVENSCADNSIHSVALALEGNYGKIDHVTSRVMEAAKQNVGIYNSGSDLTLTNVTLRVANGLWANKGILSSGIRLSLFHVVAEVSGGSDFTEAIVNNGDYLRMEHVQASATDGMNHCRGVTNNNGLYFKLIDVEASTSCSGSYSYGFYSQNGHGSLINVEAIGDRAGIYLYQSDTITSTVEMWEVKTGSGQWGIRTAASSGTMVVRVGHSSLDGTANSIYNHNSYAQMTVGSSQLEGGPVSGAVTCAGVYDESYTFYPDTCPP